MKKPILLLFCFCLLSLYSKAQFGHYTLTFDPTDTLYQSHISIDTINHHGNLWQIGSPHKSVFNSPYTAPNAIVTDTINAYPPNDTSVFYIKLPSSDPYGFFVDHLSFRYQLDIDSGSYGRVDVSTDLGMSWTDITSLSGYYYSSDTPQLNISTTGWTLYNVDYFFPMVDSVFFRFTFISDSTTTTRNGWIIDDINYSYYFEDVPMLTNDKIFNIYPNPVTTSVTITSTTIPIKHVEIINLLGQVVYTTNDNAEKVVADVGSLLPGLYLVKINDLVTKHFEKQ